jgi:FkbM family methyltransferase
MMDAKSQSDFAEVIFDLIPEVATELRRGTRTFDYLQELAGIYFSSSAFSSHGSASLGPFGDLVFPYVSMGAVSSLDLFGLDELILFAFYRQNKNRYKRFVDLGANLGLHSILVAKLGWGVTAYEPDPNTHGLLLENARANGVIGSFVQAAVAAESGDREFTRVLGNLTGSHLGGSKENPYGDLESFVVEAVSFKSVMASGDLLKVDVEGAESELLCSTTSEDWAHVDAIVEIGSMDKAKSIFEHFQEVPEVQLFAQKIGWSRVENLEDLPVGHREGSVFITSSGTAPFTLGKNS